MNVEVGGGTLCTPGWVNVDPAHGHGPDNKTDWYYTDPRYCRRIQDGVPDILDGEAEVVRMSHVLEHIPAGKERIAALNEVWRILRPGGELLTVTPCVGYTDHDNGGGPVYNGWQPWADPTHVSFWWYPESWLYLIDGPGSFKAHADYGLRPWTLGEHRLVDGWEAHVTLVKPT